MTTDAARQKYVAAIVVLFCTFIAVKNKRRDRLKGIKIRKAAWVKEIINKALTIFKTSGPATSHPEISRLFIDVVLKWQKRHLSTPEMKSVFQSKQFGMEIEESVVTTALLKENAVLDGSGNVCIVDFCSGKGYLSSFLSYIAPYLELGNVTKIFPIDLNFSFNGERRRNKRSPVGADHFWIMNEGNNVPIVPIQADIFDKKVEKTIDQETSESLIFLGVHLCRRLSARMVDLFNANQRCKLLVLSPCCIPPPRRRPLVLAGKELDLVKLHASDTSYSDWVEFLCDCIDVKEKKIVKADLTPRHGYRKSRSASKKGPAGNARKDDLARRNSFIVARRI